MTAAAAPARPVITTRPADPPTEDAYIYSTARAQTAARWGGRIVHFPSVAERVNEIMRSCVVVVATFEGSPQSILGYVAWGLDGAVEFLVLNKGLADDGREPGQPPPKGYRLHARKLAFDVLQALLKDDRAPVMRRLSAPWVMEAMMAGGFAPSVVPRAI